MLYRKREGVFLLLALLCKWQRKLMWILQQATFYSNSPHSKPSSSSCSLQEFLFAVVTREKVIKTERRSRYKGLRAVNNSLIMTMKFRRWYKQINTFLSKFSLIRMQRIVLLNSKMFIVNVIVRSEDSAANAVSFHRKSSLTYVILLSFICTEIIFRDPLIFFFSEILNVLVKIFSTLCIFNSVRWCNSDIAH
jgi:hypothetical protein